MMSTFWSAVGQFWALRPIFPKKPSRFSSNYAPAGGEGKTKKAGGIPGFARGWATAPYLRAGFFGVAGTAIV